MNPILKWAGGKRWQLPILRPLWAPHRHRRLVEPFAGGLAVSLGLLPHECWANDINSHLVNFYQQVAKGLRITIPMVNGEKEYYEIRQFLNDLIGSNFVNHAEWKKDAASAFYYLNRTGFNGLCRFNKSGLYNVPFGKYAMINYRREFPDEQAWISKWLITGYSFEQMLWEPDDFIYADPPYDDGFVNYSGDFRFDAQERLAHKLAIHPGPVVATNKATPRIVELYTSLGFTVQYLDAPRRISCTGDREPVREMLAMRNV